MLSSIWVNGRFQTQKITGVQRYAVEVCQKFGTKVSIATPPRLKYRWSGHIWEQLQLPKQIDQGALLWSPANTGPLSVKNQVVTIHDMGTFDHPEWFARRFSLVYKMLLPRLATNTKHVITDSLNAKSRITDVFKLPEDKVSVIYPGVSNFFKPASIGEVQKTLKRFGLDHGYLLYLGSLNPRKNLFRLFDAFDLVRKTFPDIMLVIVGAPFHTFRGKGIKLIPPGVKLLGYVDDSYLPALYAGALAFIYISLYEGFGLPILEAMACGAAVVASDTTSMPEVVGDAGLLVDPYNVNFIADAIQKIIYDRELREHMQEKGIERAKQFPWESTAARVWEVLIKAAGEL